MLREAILVNDWLEKHPNITIRFKKETFVIFRAFLEEGQDSHEVSFIHEEALLKGEFNEPIHIPESVHSSREELEEVFRCALKLFRQEAESHGDDLVRQIFKGTIYLWDNSPQVSYEKIWVNNKSK
jgi:hypothetical protein